MEDQLYDYNERDGWPDELIAAHWRMRYAIIYCELLKAKAAETNYMFLPNMESRIAEAERQAQKAIQIYKSIFERWNENGRYKRIIPRCKT